MKEGYFKVYFAVLEKEVNNIPRGLKSKLVKSLLNHSEELCGKVTREKGILKGVSTEPVLYIKTIVGNPYINSNWKTIRSIIETIFEPCEVFYTNKALPLEDATLRKQLHVGETTIEARRTGTSVASSSTEDIVNEQAKRRIEFNKYSSSNYTFLKDKGDQDSYDNEEISTDEEGDLFESVSEVAKRTRPKYISNPILQRASGIIKIGNVELDKSKPKAWTSDQLIVLLKDCDKGVGLSEKSMKDIDIGGTDIDNIVDALIMFNGDKEAKIAHATKEINCYPMVAESIVRWVFSNLLEYLPNFIEIPSGSESSNSCSSYELPQTHLRTKHITTPILQRASGTLKIGDVELDKSKPKSWKSNQILILLEDIDVGVGLDEEDISNTKLKGNLLENIVDALIRFNGDKEAKIAHATNRLAMTLKNYGISEAIVRWVFHNLLEYQINRC